MTPTRTLKRSLILSFAAAAILPILIISLLALYDLTGERTHDIDEKNLLLAKAVSGQFEGFLREPQATLQSISGVLESYPEMPEDEIQEFLDIIVKNSELFESIYIVSLQGDMSQVGLQPERTGLRKDFRGISIAHMPFFQKTLQTGEPAWSDTFFSVISGEISLAFTLPIKRGILVGNFSIRPLTDFVKTLHQTESLTISVVDRTGTTIAHPDPALASQQVHIGHLAPVRAVLQGKETTLPYAFRQEDYIGSAALIPGPNWAVLVSQTSADAYRPVRHAGMLFIVGAIGAILLSVIFSLNKTFRLSTPLYELTAKTEGIANGQYDIFFADSGYAEFDKLTDNVRHMATAIRDREYQLMKSRERYRLLVETMRDGLIVLDQNGIITYSNTAFTRLIDPPATSINGRSPLDFLDKTNQTLFTDHIKRQTKDPDPLFEIEWTRSNGEQIVTEVSATPLYEENNYIGSFAVINDITERNKAEERVKQSLREAEESREKIDAILKSVPLGLIVTNMQGRIILMNRSVTKTLGYRTNELIQQPIETVLNEPEFQNYFAAILADSGTEESIDLDLFDHGLGQVRTIQISGSLVQSQKYAQSGVIIVLNDVTGERESDRLKSEFIATAAHELSTPLTAIMGYAELLLKQEELGDFPPKQLREFYETIYERGEALNRITDDLLDLSHMESGRAILLDKKPHIIEEIIDGTVNQFRRESPVRIFEVQLNNQKTELEIDRGRIIQVLENLIGNATKYSHISKTVTIAGFNQQNSYRIEVVDNGIGMTQEQVSRIFEKFYRANPTHTSVSGLGMGMSIVKNIIDAHAGQIDIESLPEQGTKITVRLPRQ